VIYQIQQTRGAALAPLSNEQKRKLAAMAHYAYIEAGPDQDFDDWRHDQVRECVSKGGLTECCNADYNPLKAHFLALSGNVVGSMKATVKSATEPRQWALSSLMKACTEAKDVMPEAMKYARGFVLNKRGVTLEDADDRTIWHAVFVVRRKAQSERKKKRGGVPAGDVLGKVLGYSSLNKKSSGVRKTAKGPF